MLRRATLIRLTQQKRSNQVKFGAIFLPILLKELHMGLFLLYETRCIRFVFTHIQAAICRIGNLRMTGLKLWYIFT